MTRGSWMEMRKQKQRVNRHNRGGITVFGQGQWVCWNLESEYPASLRVVAVSQNMAVRIRHGTRPCRVFYRVGTATE